MNRKPFDMRVPTYSQRIDYWTCNSLLAINHVLVTALLINVTIFDRSITVRDFLFLYVCAHGPVLIFTGTWQMISSLINWYRADASEWRQRFKWQLVTAFCLVSLFFIGMLIHTQESPINPFEKIVFETMATLYFCLVIALSWRYQLLLRRYYGL